MTKTGRSANPFAPAYNVCSAMAVIVIRPLGVRAQIRPGQRLLDVLDDAGRPAFRTACRAGNCGACRLTIVTGELEWRAPSSREHSTLMQLRAAGNERLGCQLVLQGDPPSELVVETKG
jgi:ferredoxin